MAAKMLIYMELQPQRYTWSGGYYDFVLYNVCLVWTFVPASNAFSVIYFSVCGIALLCWVFIGCLAVNVELAVVVPCRKSAHSAHWLFSDVGDADMICY